MVSPCHGIGTTDFSCTLYEAGMLAKMGTSVGRSLVACWPVTQKLIEASRSSVWVGGLHELMPIKALTGLLPVSPGPRHVSARCAGHGWSRSVLRTVVWWMCGSSATL